MVKFLPYLRVDFRHFALSPLSRFRTTIPDQNAFMTIVKKLLVIAAVGVLVVAVAFIVLGFFVPTERSFANEIDIDAPADRVWQVMTDKQRYPEWQDQLDRVEIISDQEWIEYPKNAPEPLRFQLVNDGRPSRMEVSYTMGEAMYGHWSGEMMPTAKGVKLKTIDSYKTNGWFMKIMLATFFDLDAFAKDWNGKLKHRAEALAKE